jgi:hypothetical protein
VAVELKLANLMFLGELAGLLGTERGTEEATLAALPA